MIPDPLTTPTNAFSPDADRAGEDASARLPEWVAYLIALIIHCVLQAMLAGRSRRPLLPSWWYDRPDLPPASAQAMAASARGPFGNAIAWMCRCRGIGPGHPEWPELSRAIVAFGGSVKGARAGLPACATLWWENPNLVPAMICDAAATPAADALGLLLSRQAAEAAASPAPANPASTGLVRSAAAPALPPAFRRRVVARTATGPPTGPPADWAPQLCCA